MRYVLIIVFGSVFHAPGVVTLDDSYKDFNRCAQVAVYVMKEHKEQVRYALCVPAQ